MDKDKLLEKLAVARTQDEYDRLVDKYVFGINKYNRNTKKRRKKNQNILSVNQLAEIHKLEKPYDFTKPWL